MWILNIDRVRMDSAIKIQSHLIRHRCVTFYTEQKKVVRQVLPPCEKLSKQFDFFFDFVVTVYRSLLSVMQRF